MNVMTVGNENLPNVFIEKIFVYPRNQGGNKIVVKLTMFDHSPTSGGFPRSWRRPELSDLQIKIVFAGGNASDELNNGTSSLFDWSEQLDGVLLLSANDFAEEEELEGYTKFSKTVEIASSSPDINVHVACYIDGLNFGNDLFNKFYGPMSSEIIFVGGEINTSTGYFYYPKTNKEYAGPVHQHPGKGYMEGSMHQEEDHAKLSYVVEENYKIVMPPTSVVPPMNLESLYIQESIGGAFGIPGIMPGADETFPQGPSGAPNVTTNQSTLGNVVLSTPGGGSVQAGVGSYSDAGISILTERPQAQNLLGNVNFEVRDAVRRGTY